jgi:hypothetical protein
MTTQKFAIAWKSLQGYVAITDLLHGKCFLKGIGPEDGECSHGRDNVAIQSLRDLYANRRVLLKANLATEVGTRTEAASWPATLHMPHSSEYVVQITKVPTSVANCVESKVEKVERRCGWLMYHTLTILSAGFHVPIWTADDKGRGD